MKASIVKSLKSPLFWLALILTFFVLKNNIEGDRLNHVIRSDGRGYYAYLPAFFIYDDPSFQKSTEAEKRVTDSGDQFYLFKDSKGKMHNKYFPGIAIMQAPFFGMACSTSWLMGQEINGYSNIFQFFLLLGSLFYSLLGILLFYRCLNLLFPEHERKIPWLITIFYLSSPLWFYSVVTPSFTHQHSFFLFGLFSFIALKIKEKSSWQLLLLLGLLTGLIAIVRPTNVLVVLMLPFLIGSTDKLKGVWKELTSNSGEKIWIGLAGFFSMIFFLFLIWRWQSGEWFVWSYKGEGFNWLRPHLLENLFSFRIGLFVHTPMLLFTLIGTYFLYKKNKFQFIFWWIYFLINMWVISAWWCWDYESSFGNRPNTEHIFFLVLPIFYLFDKNRKWVWGILIFFCLINLYRFQQYTTGAHPNQRFTAASYFKSLQFWKSYPEYRFNFTRSPEAFGDKLEEKVLLDFQGEKVIHAKDQFPLGGETVLDTPRTFERYYYRVELDKKIRTENFDGVNLVVDAYNDDMSKRHYLAIDLFNDREEGKKDWKHLIFEGTIIDNFQDYTYLKIYIWNHKGKELSVRNVKITLTKYMAE
jgi:hypothetical protein|tara:strand:+ start:1032 stop:2783 length:1752 start_codon:yes stop_codon:yes gene_type:complete